MPKTKPEDRSPERVLERMGVPDHDGVYVLGCLSSPLTFHAQQQRACNLVWALMATKRLTPAQSMLIVGGGLAGLTAAALACSEGMRVTLVERVTPLYFQDSSSHHRFIHPNVYEWPDPGWSIESTDLPCLNWEAGYLPSVVSTIKEQWDNIVRTEKMVVLEKTEIVEGWAPPEWKAAERKVEPGKPWWKVW
jgi:hypothetical protein